MIENAALQEKIGDRRFFSAPYRLFKLDDLEPACEDYGQAVVYKGSIEHHRDAFVLDGHHIIETGKMFPVCGNTYRMLNDTRFKEHFDFYGNWETHFGIFEGCGSELPFEGESQLDSPGACC